MAKPFRLRYVNEIAGTFVLGTFALVIAGVVMTGYGQRWFTPTQRVVLNLPEAGSVGLRRGADVLIQGTAAGSVDDVAPDPATGRIQAILRVRDRFMKFVTPNSVVQIRQSLAGVGDAFVDIQKGTGEPFPRNAAELSSSNIQISHGAAEMAEETMRKIQEAAVPAINRIGDASQQIALVAADLHSPQGNLQQALAHINTIASRLESGEGLAGRILSDRALADQITQTLPKLNSALEELHGVIIDARKTTATLPELSASMNEDLKRIPALIEQTQDSMRQVNAILKDVQKTTAGLPETTKGLNQTVQSLPGLVIQMQETLRQIQRLVEGAQRSWLVRPYMDQPAAGADGSRISPDRVGQ